jgi:hypothetical protein
MAGDFQAKNNWLGSWEFVESWTSLDTEVHNSVVYALNIKQIGRRIVVDLDIDGYQSLQRIRGEGKIIKNSIQVFYSGVHEGNDNMMDVFKKGDLLFELSLLGDNVLTTWKELKPELDEYQKVGIYFKKK